MLTTMFMMQTKYNAQSEWAVNLHIYRWLPAVPLKQNIIECLVYLNKIRKHCWDFKLSQSIHSTHTAWPTQFYFQSNCISIFTHPYTQMRAIFESCKYQVKRRASICWCAFISMFHVGGRYALEFIEFGRKSFFLSLHNLTWWNFWPKTKIKYSMVVLCLMPFLF